MPDTKTLATSERSDAPTAPSGYKISMVLAQWQAAREALLSNDPAFADDEAALVEALGPEESDVREILSRLMRGAVLARDMANVADERAKTIQGRRDRYRARAENMTIAALSIMQITGERRFEIADLTASIRRNPDAVLITSEDELPDIYWREVTTRAPDKALLSKTLKAGTEVRGATLSNGSEILQIRTK